MENNNKDLIISGMEDYTLSNIYQENKLLQSCKNFTILQGRIFYLALTQINPHLKNSTFYHKELPEINIPTNVIISIMGGNPGYYERLKVECEELGSKKVIIEIDDRKKKFDYAPIFRRIKFEAKEGLTIRFSEEMKPFILDLQKGNYTYFQFKEILNLSRMNAVHLLELLLQYKNLAKNNIVKRTISVTDMKRFFGVEILEKGKWVIPEEKKSYTQIGSFIRRIITPSVAAINKNTKYNVDYSVKRIGRKIDSFTFYLTMPAADENKLIKSNNYDNLAAYTEEKFEEVKDAPDSYYALIELGVGPTVAERLLKSLNSTYGSNYGQEKASEYTDQHISANIEYARKHKNTIKNMPAYMVMAIKNNYADYDPEIEQLNLFENNNNNGFNFTGGGQKEKINMQPEVQEVPEVNKLTPFIIDCINSFLNKNEEVPEHYLTTIKKLGYTIEDIQQKRYVLE